MNVHVREAEKQYLGSLIIMWIASVAESNRYGLSSVKLVTSAIDLGESGSTVSTRRM